jgi:hypothetical protein
VLLKFIDHLRKCNGRLAVLTPSSLRHRPYRRPRPLRRPLRLLLRLAPVAGGHRQLPTDQKGLSRDFLDVCCSCPMVPLLPLGKRSVPNAPAGGTLRAAGAASTAEQSRWAAKGAGWECLTFDIKGEIIVGVEWIAVVPANSTLFSPSSALILFFILGSCLLRIQHS